MTIKTRLIILAVCVMLFLVVTPYIVLYSLGYRVDFENLAIMATGGIYVHATPTDATVTVDGAQAQSVNLFSTAVFMQNLLPKNHTVSITKTSYFPYQKTLKVAPNQVTKLENVQLFKTSYTFTPVGQNVQFASLSPSGHSVLFATPTENGLSFTLTGIAKPIILEIAGARANAAIWNQNENQIVITVNSAYYLLDSSKQLATMTALPYLKNVKQIGFDNNQLGRILFAKNSNLYASNTPTNPLIKNLVAWQQNSQTIRWLGQDGLLYAYDMQAKTSSYLSSQPITIDPRVTYTLTEVAGKLFLQQGTTVLVFNQAKSAFEPFCTNALQILPSEDNQKILCQEKNQLTMHLLTPNAILAPDGQETLALQTTSQPINAAAWLNNDYVLSLSGDNITISEIDTRGNINAITLPKTATLVDETTLPLTKMQLFWDRQNNRLYIVTQGQLIVSEKLL